MIVSGSALPIRTVAARSDDLDDGIGRKGQAVRLRSDWVIGA